MGKNKAKARFNEQRKLMSSLRATEEQLPSSAAAIFSVSRAEPVGSDDADVPEYPLFLVAIQDLRASQDKSKGLAELWKRAYQLGKQEGADMDAFDAAMLDDDIQEAHDNGWQDGYESGAASGEKKGYEAGFKDGVTKIEEAFVGHVALGECHVGRKPRVDIGVATEKPFPPTFPTHSKPPTAHSDSSTDYQSAVDENPPLQWADDPELAPVHQISTKQPTRDISALRTPDIKKPFGSLQRRLQKTRLCDSQTIYLHDRNEIKTTPLVRRKHRSRKRDAEAQTSCPNDMAPRTMNLDWARDPRLNRLAHALQDLGWVLPMRFR